jgi:ABC-type multidrug transport system ATPase subunit/pSer/pThr/pTyr-binding forkhead associated (FHA) protein
MVMAQSQMILRYRQGNGPWGEVVLVKERYVLGRGDEVDIVLDCQQVSRLHASLEIHDDKIFITDLNSTNGVYLEDVRIESNNPVAVQPGMMFHIDCFTLRIDQIALSAGAPGSAPTPVYQFLKQEDGKQGVYMIRYRRAKGPWQEYRPTHPEILIGRASDCQVYLNSPNVSRRHAKIEFSDKGMLLTDLGSTNGIQINGVPLPPRSPVSLPENQSFLIGEYEFQIVTVEYHPMAAQIRQTGTIQMSDILQQPVVQHPLELKQTGPLSIGKAGDNDLVLDHPMVSRYHAQIERIGARIQIKDLRSTNGVYINGVRLEDQTWLKDKDKIQIGPYGFTLSGQSLRPHAEEGLLLEAKNITQFVSKRLNLLQNINLLIRPMEFVAIVGMSGSGKTTLMNALSGYKPATGGQVIVNGVDLYKHYDMFRNDMGYVPQKDIVHAELTPQTALEYVAKLRMPADASNKERSNAVKRVLSELDLLERKDVPISRLSGGQLKRVSIGVELLTRPRLFFLDEPTSGLDPGTEYEMMRLLRQLADQGRTVMLVTHATKNVILCDKVVFLARGGFLAFFGAPDQALEYFDQFRTPKERQQKVMEFDDIYRILGDEKRGTAVEWGARYMTSPYYREMLDKPEAPSPVRPKPASAPVKTSKPLARSKRRVSALRQFFILSQRNVNILVQDKVSLALMLALAPGIGLLDFIWGNQLYDPVVGDAAKIFTMWFMTALITVLVGALASVREIVKEVDIYRRERAVNLKILPYLFSKLWVGIVLGIYQAAILLFTRVVLNRPEMPGAGAYAALFFTLFLSTLCGYMVGLVISSSAPNQNAAMLLIIAVLVPQFMFAGALLPLDLIPGGEAISVIMPTRWAFEAFINITEMGKPIVEDPCWQLPASERKSLLEEEKDRCACWGINLFKSCTSFPGIFSADFYDEKTAFILAQPAPVEPVQPTAIPYPTAYPSPTSLPTPTLLPSLTPLPSPTPLPTPADLRKMQDYMDESAVQGQEYMDLRTIQGSEYQDQILDQFTGYREASQIQGQEYADLRTEQGDTYADLRQEQGDTYQDDMQTYADERSEYEEARQKAISGAETMLDTINTNFGRAFLGDASDRWVRLTIIMFGLMLLLVGFQKMKDVK